MPETPLTPTVRLLHIQSCIWILFCYKCCRRECCSAHTCAWKLEPMRPLKNSVCLSSDHFPLSPLLNIRVGCCESTHFYDLRATGEPLRLSEDLVQLPKFNESGVSDCILYLRIPRLACFRKISPLAVASVGFFSYYYLNSPSSFLSPASNSILFCSLCCMCLVCRRSLFKVPARLSRLLPPLSAILRFFGILGIFVRSRGRGPILQSLHARQQSGFPQGCGFQRQAAHRTTGVQSNVGPQRKNLRPWCPPHTHK